MYRIFQTLTVFGGRKIAAGRIDTLQELIERAPENLPVLIERGIIARVAAPPLIAINEDWRRIATRLEKHGIINLDDFLQADDASLRRWLRTNAAAIARLKAEARRLLMPE